MVDLCPKRQGEHKGGLCHTDCAHTFRSAEALSPSPRCDCGRLVSLFFFGSSSLLTAFEVCRFPALALGHTHTTKPAFRFAGSITRIAPHCTTLSTLESLRLAIVPDLRISSQCCGTCGGQPVRFFVKSGRHEPAGIVTVRRLRVHACYALSKFFFSSWRVCHRVSAPVVELVYSCSQEKVSLM